MRRVELFYHVKTILEEPGLILDEIRDEDYDILRRLVRNVLLNALKEIKNDLDAAFRIDGVEVWSFSSGILGMKTWNALYKDVTHKDVDWFYECAPEVVKQLRLLANKIERYATRQIAKNDSAEKRV